MSMNWEYALLSKKACAAGGPAAYTTLLFDSGLAAGHAEMLPYCFGAALGGLALGALGTVLVTHQQKKQLAKAAAMRREAEEGLAIAGEALTSEVSSNVISEPEETSHTPSAPNQDTIQAEPAVLT